MDEKTNKLGRLPPIKTPDILLHSNSGQIQSLHPQVTYAHPLLCSLAETSAHCCFRIWAGGTHVDALGQRLNGCVR